MVVFDRIARPQHPGALQARNRRQDRRAAPLRAARSRCRWGRRCRRRALPAPGRSDGRRDRRSGRSCPRSTGNSAAPSSGSGRNTSASDAHWRGSRRGSPAVVRVMPHSICGVVIRSVSTENGSGGSSPGCISTAPQSMVVPSSRGGVPVFSRPSAKPIRSNAADRPSAGASSIRPAGQLRSPRWIRPRRKVPVVITTAPAANSRPSASRMPVIRPSAVSRSSASPSITRQIGGRPDRRLHRRGVELAVGLGARARAPPAPCGD